MAKDKEVRIKLEAEYKQAVAAMNKAGKALEDFDRTGQHAAAGAGKLSDAMGSLSQKMDNLLGDMTASMVKGQMLAAALGMVADAVAGVVKEMVSLGTQTEQVTAKFGAMANNLTRAAETYQIFNDVGRNTNYDMSAVNEMGRQLINLGYNAQTAAEMITIVSDTAARLGEGQAGAEALISSLNRMKSTGMFTVREMKALQEQGIKVEEALAAAFGVSTQEAIEMVKQDAVDGKDAFEILTNYMQNNFAGGMADAKNNLVDMWGDVTGNLQTAMGEIGAAISEAFSQSGIVQDLIDITQDFVDLVRSDGNSVFRDLKIIAGEALKYTADRLKTIYQYVKLVIIIGNEMYQAFKYFGSEIAKGLSVILSPLKKVWSVVSSIVSTLGSEISKGIDASWADMVGGGYYDEGTSNAALDGIKYKGNGNYRAKAKEESGGASGGSRGRSEADKSARIQQELERQTQQIKEKTAAIIGNVAKEQTKYNEILRQTNMIGLDGAELEEAQYDNAMANLEAEQKAIKAAAEAKVTALMEEADALQKQVDSGLAPDGTQAKIDALYAQIAAENALTAAQLTNKDALMEKATKEYENQKAQKTMTAQIEAIGKKSYETLAAGITNCIMAGEDLGKTMQSIFKQMLQEVLQLIIKWTILTALMGVGGGIGKWAGGARKTAFGLASGGLVSGPGSGTSDTAGLFALSNGEYVLPAAAVQQVGTPFLDGLRTGRFKGLAAGGMVGKFRAEGTDAAAVGGGAAVTLNVSTLSADSFKDFLSRDGIGSVMDSMTAAQRMFNNGGWK